MDGLPNLRILKHWTLIGFHCYLFFSLNFVGVFANEYPPRISSYSRVSDVVDKQEVSLFSLFVYFFQGQPPPNSNFRASPKEG